MDVYSPEDSKVIEVASNIASGVEVKEGQFLLRLDPSRYESRLAQIELLKKRKELQNRRYSDEEISKDRNLAQLAVDLTQKRREHVGRRFQILHSKFDLHALAELDFLSAEADIAVAIADEAAARLKQKQLEYGLDARSRMNALLDMHFQHETEYLKSRISRLTVIAPCEGTVRLNVAVGSVTGLGCVLLSIEG